MQEKVKIDVLIIGAGIIGCAVASRISQLQKMNGKTIVIAEAGPRIAEGVTSRNSGVVHAGIYYPPHSLKAKTCVRGNALLYEWAQKHNVPIKNLGKLIVASGEKQIEVLQQIFINANESGAKDLSFLSRDEVTKREPSLKMDAAIWCPTTGIVDQFALTKSFLSDAQSRDVILTVNNSVKNITKMPSGSYQVMTSEGLLETEIIINCAGLNSDEIAAMAQINKYKIYPCRGDYFTFHSKVKFNHLIYPVKEPGAPGLGVHLTIDIDGKYKLGPDTEYVMTKNQFTPAEHKLEKFKTAAEKIFGPLEASQLSYDSCGIRPKLRSPEEKEERDFIVSEDQPGFINMVGIESPGLTASLALADMIVGII
ncbi:MAG: NAD(P)/FAD-dependent oxidoreductase [Oligoflexia bacterium]|nr:NAD(P)/FAD-dependent oxidoreductase [Oligoflexia bacterium]